jgi:riboflavin kinase/FMN adenylyltransferase
MTDSKKWYQSRVTHGKKLGRTIGYPTINLDNPELLEEEKEGVYGALVNIDGKIYQGALYYGPRKVLKETTNVIEIFVFDFSKELYDQKVTFSLHAFIRGVMDFADFSLLKKQLESDCDTVKNYFRNASQ